MKRLKSERIHEGKLVTLMNDTYKLPNNSSFTAEVLKYRNAVCVAASNDDGKTFFIVKQFRYGVRKSLIEFPAGLIDEDERPDVAALRELEEETGYRAGQLVALGSINPSPATSSETIHLFYATQLEYVGQDLDETEFLTVSSLPLAEILSACDKGVLTDSKTVALAFKIDRFLNRG